MREVLVIDDDEGDRVEIQEALGRIGLGWRATDGLGAGLEALAAARPDAVLLDLRMPGVVGMDGVRAVRAAAPGTPIVVLTSVGDVEVSVEALRSGAHDYLVKGEFSSEELERRLRHAAERAQVDGHVQAPGPGSIRCCLLDPDGLTQDVAALVRSALSRGPVVYVALRRAPGRVEEDLGTPLDGLSFIDATGQGGARSPTRAVSSPVQLEAIALRIERAIAEFDAPAYVLVDTLGHFALYNETPLLQEFVHRLGPRLRSLGAGCDLIVTKDDEGRLLSQLLQPYLDP